MSKSLYVGIVAGEPSGDLLAAELISALKRYYPNLTVKGIAGSAMEKLGFESLYPMETLSVMGLPLLRLPAIIAIRRRLKQYFLKNRPDIFIGIDSPDFNLGLELALKSAGIKVVHYVSPTIWAWRLNRVHKIKKACDLVLCLLPFEPAIYRQYQVKALFVGHPLANRIPFAVDKQAARCHFGLHYSDQVLAVLPGSRVNEIKYLGKLFVETLKICQQQLPQLKIIIPMVNEQHLCQFKRYLSGVKNVMMVKDQSQRAMIASDVVLLACGTAALEAMLIKRPMVVAYKTSAITYYILKLLVKTPYFSLPNILTKRPLVPEFIQHQATAQALSLAVMEKFKHSYDNLLSIFRTWHQKLQQNANNQAVVAIESLLTTKD